MRSAKYYLEKDMKDKFSALSIDKNCTDLNNKSPHIYFTDQSANIEGK
jgi:tektin-1